MAHAVMFAALQEEQAKKAAAAPQAATKQAAALEDDEGDELDANLYYERRVKAIQSAKEAGHDVFPHKFQVGTPLVLACCATRA